MAETRFKENTEPYEVPSDKRNETSATCEEGLKRVVPGRAGDDAFPVSLGYP